VFETFAINPDLKALYDAQDAAPEIVPCTNDPDLYFPEGPQQDWEKEMIKAACNSCPILKQCAAYGEKYATAGVWGGKRYVERPGSKG
jgi:hypothetical protein